MNCMAIMSLWTCLLTCAQHQLAVCLRWLCKFGIFSIVPVQGSISYSNVAILVSVNEAELKSVCRMAITSGLFTEPETNRIAHTATSSLLATNADFAGWATCVTDEIYESSSKMGWAVERWPKSTLPSHSAFNLAYGTSMPFIDYMRQSPSLSKSFSSFLRATQSVEANSFRHLMNSFDWESIGSGVIVEVTLPVLPVSNDKLISRADICSHQIGSSTADPCIKLAQKFPLLRFHLQPLPRSTREVKAHVESLESEFASRFTVESDLMFAPQPKRDVDVFLLRHALHHFPEETSLSILGNIATVLDPRARILVMDLVLPLNATVDPYQESMCRMRDLIHRALSNGQTRHLSEWNLLFQKAHKCFEIVSAVTPSGSDLTMLEIQIKDDRATKKDSE